MLLAVEAGFEPASSAFDADALTTELLQLDAE